MSAPSTLRGNPKELIRFLSAFRPGGPWVLSAIHPVTEIMTTETFTDSAAAEAWVAKRDGVENLYLSVNPTIKPMSKKTAKTDIRGAEFLHVDCDPRTGESLEMERRRIEKLLFGFVPKPSVIVDSGGGYNAYWRLDKEYRTDGSEEKAKEIEVYNHQLKNLLGADPGTANIDRILRLPWSVNIPTKKKIKKGRTERTLAMVVKEDLNLVYPLSDFTPAPVKNKSYTNGSGGPNGATHTVNISGNLPPVLLDDLPPGVTRRTKMLICQGDDPDDPEKYKGDRSRVVMAVTVALCHAGCTNDQIASVLLDKNNRISDHIYDQGKPQEYTERQIRRAREGVAEDAATDAAEAQTNGEDKPTRIMQARELLTGRGARLIWYNGEWLSYRGGAYQARENDGIRAEAYRKFPSSNQNAVSNVLDAMKGLIHLDRNDVTPPCWLDGRQGPDPARLLVLRNGILDLETEVLAPHSDTLFTRNALDFDFDPNAASPARWLKFLEEVWPEEVDCRNALQRVFGYLLTPDTSLQIIPVLYGPTRCGKGTIARVLGRLLGRHNVCSPSVRSMSGDFGMQCMIGKQVALVPDMRMGPKTDKAAVAEILLSISGEDDVCVHRKNTTDWEGRLGVRFMINTNDPPTLNDPSGALLARYRVLQMRQSFLGREDFSLTDTLMVERPGILNWAIEGWRLLRAEGRLKQPGSAEETTKIIRRLTAPISAFVEDECDIDPEGQVEKDALYKRFKDWCRAQNRPWAGKETFAKRLLQTCGGVKASRPRGDEDGKREQVYCGIKLKPAPVSKKEEPEQSELGFAPPADAPPEEPEPL